MRYETAKKESEEWLKESKRDRHELFSELDILLRALDKFFIAENLPSSIDNINNRNFYNELNASKDAVLRAIAILETVIPENKRNEYWFRKFAETRLMSGMERDIAKQDLYRQDTQERSLYVLYDTLANIKNLISDIMKSRGIPYLSFKNIGQLIGKELRENVFFNPFRHEFDPELDTIQNKIVSDTVKGIKKRDIKKAVSVIFIFLFRISRGLEHMEHQKASQSNINCALVILMFIKSEITLLRDYIEKSSRELPDQELGMLLSGLSFQFSIESKRVFKQELRNIFENKPLQYMKGKIENSRGIIKNLAEQAVIQMVKFWKPDVKEDSIFDVFITRTGQSIKLREDSYVLHRLILHFENKSYTAEQREKILHMLMTFMDYFESFTFKLLRYDDYEEFSTLFGKIKYGYNMGANINDTMEKCHQLDVLLETTLRHVENRAELKDRPLDIEKAEDIVREYIPSL